MRRTLASLVALVFFGVPVSALAQAPGFDTPPSNASTSEPTPSGQAQQQAGGATSRAQPTPPAGGKAGGQAPAKTKPKRTRRCSTRGQRRTCRISVGGRHVRTCVRARRGARERCRVVRSKTRVQASASAASSSFSPSALSRAGAQKSRLRAVLRDPRVRARISTVTQHGYQDNVVPAVGRFYYQASQGENPLKAWCSGTLILRGVVLTAAHCLYQNTWDERVTGKRSSSPAGYFDIRQMSFTPGHTINGQGGPAGNYGTWGVADAFVSEAYKADEDAQDWALVLLAPRNGAYPGDSTGTFAAHGGVSLGFNAPLVKMGYPASGAFAKAEYWYGSRQYYCSIAWQQRRVPAGGTISPNGWYMLAEGCPMNGGSSGGPVFAKFSDGSYGIIGVNNRGSGRTLTDPFGFRGINLWFDQTAISFFNSVIQYWNR